MRIKHLANLTRSAAPHPDKLKQAMASYTTIKLTWHPTWVQVTLDRPDKLNPLDWGTVRELRTALAEINANNEVIAAVITGAGRSFSAGGDLAAYVDMYKDGDQYTAFLEDFYQLLTGLEASEKIIIAAVNGVCVAGGLELLLACDIVIAADTAKIGDGHTNFGQLPGAGGSQRLPRAIGLTQAKDLIFTGELLPAAEAQRIGLVNRVVPAASFDKEVEAYVQLLAQKSPAGLKTAKRLVNMTMSLSLNEGLRREIEILRGYVTTEPDATEGLIAFAEKRKPAFSR